MLNKLLRLYKRGEKERCNTPKEDFSTEIFAGILKMEEDIRNDFIYNFLKLPEDNYIIDTQVKYLLVDDDNCIIDIVIKGDNCICFIENKIEAKEGDRQIERYAKILDLKIKEEKKTYLFYCTKYNDKKEYNFHNFAQYRWHNISAFLKKYINKPFVAEFIKFLKTHDMEQEMTFDAKDFITLSNLQNIINKTYEYLDRVKPEFEKTFSSSNKNCQCHDIKQIKQHNRIIYFYKDILGSIPWTELRYGFLLIKPEIYGGIWVDKKNDQYDKFHNTILNYKDKYLVNTLPNGSYIELKKDISEYLNHENAEKEITDWFKHAFEEFKKFIGNTSLDLDWNIKVRDN